MKRLPFTVVSTTVLPEPHRSRLRDSFERVRFDGDTHDAEGVFCLASNRVDASFIKRAPRLRVISLMAVGWNNVDIEEATRRGIVVTNTPGVLTDATADLTMALLLATARRLAEGDRDVRAGRFRGWGPFEYLGADLKGRVLGIVGPGRIGRAVARRARGFGLRVIFADRRKESLRRVLRGSDFVSLHCPLNEETRHLIGERELRSMKSSAMLINTARGAVVDERALIRALRLRWIAGAGLDVYEFEPAVPAALKRMDNVVLLPHIGSATRGTRDAMASLAIDNLIAVFSGRRPRHPVNPSVLERRSLRSR